MSKHKELANHIQKNDLVRRVADIKVEEITFAEKGALGDEADAVLLFKEDVEAVTGDTATDVAAEEAVEETVVVEDVSAEAELEKTTEEVAPEMTCEDAIALLKAQELTDEQKDSVLSFASSLFEDVDLVKEDESTSNAVSEVADEPESVMQLLKSIKESLDNLQVKPEPVVAEDEPVLIEKELETPVSFLDEVEQLLRKSQDEKMAHGRATQDSVIMQKLDDLATKMAGFHDKFESTRRTLDRACGEDA
jgi:hypothetical protein